MPEYKLDHFYVDSTDKRGHNEKVQITVSPSVYGEIGSLVGDPKFAEYRTMADFVRDAIIHRLHYLSTEFETTPELERLVLLQIELADMARQQRRKASADALVDSFVDQFRDASREEAAVLKQQVAHALDTLDLTDNARRSLERLL